MTAGQQAATYGNAANLYNVTYVEYFGGYQFVRGAAGTLTPANYGAVPVHDIGSSYVANTFFFALLNPSLPANYFSKIEVRDSAGVWRTFTAASGSVSADSAATYWEWATGAAPVWTGPGSSQFRLYPGK